MTNLERQENEAKEPETGKREDRGKNRDYPLHNLNQALEVAKVAIDMKGRATKEDIGLGIKKSGGSLTTRMAAARQWGLTTGIGEIKATPLAQKILIPMNDEEESEGKREAYFSVKLFREIYDIYKWELPPQKEMLKNMLVRTKGVKSDDAAKIVDIILWSKEHIFGNKIVNLNKDNKAESGINFFEYTKDSNNPQIVKKVSSLDEGTYFLILSLGKLQELSKKGDITELSELLNSMKEKCEEYPLLKSQIELLLNSVLTLEEGAFKNVLSPLVKNLERLFSHELHIS